MNYGYMIVYADKDGFDIPYFEEYRGNMAGVAHYFNNENDATYHLCDIIVYYQNKLQHGHTRFVKKRKWLLFKQTVTERTPLTSEEHRNIEFLIKRLRVKRVMVA
jgi:hypothetical protein